MRVPWLEWRDEGPGWQGVLLPLAAAGVFYGLGARIHRGVYENRWLARRDLGCTVVSVGSPVVGGTGKTPLAAWIASHLRGTGRKVALATRGYGRSRGEDVTVLSDGRFIYSDPARAGDEPLILASRARGVPILIARDRGLAGLRAVSLFGSDCLVLDDGFHHHRLERDLEVLAFDARFGLGNRRVLPRGPLREPLSALSRADVIVEIDGTLPEADRDRIARSAPDAPFFTASRRPEVLQSLDGRGRAPLAALVDAEVGMLSAIGRPASFRRTLEACGARIVAERTFPDHHRYRRADLRGLARRAPIWITTEKDAVKIPPSWTPGVDVRVLRVGLEVDEPDRLGSWLEERLRAVSTAVQRR